VLLFTAVPIGTHTGQVNVGASGPFEIDLLPRRVFGFRDRLMRLRGIDHGGGMPIKVPSMSPRTAMTIFAREPRGKRENGNGGASLLGLPRVVEDL